MYLFKSFGLISLSKVIYAATSYLLLILYTNALNPEDYGKISLIWIFVTVISIIIDFRLNTAFSIKYYKEDKTQNITNIYSVLIFNFLILICIYCVFVFFPQLLDYLIGFSIDSNVKNLVFVLLFFMVWGNFFTNLLMISKEAKKYFYVMCVFNIVLIFSSILLLRLSPSNYLVYLISFFLAYFFVTLLGIVHLFLHFRPTKNTFFCTESLQRLIRISLPLIPDGLLLYILSWADRYMLDYYSGLYIVGIYTVAYSFSTFISYLNGSFGQAITPLIYEIYSKSVETYKKIINMLLKCYWLVLSALVLGYLILLKEVYHFFIASNYSEGFSVLPLLIFGVVVSGATSYFGATILLKEKTNVVFLFTFIAVVSNILMNFALIPIFGIYGAATATLLSYFIQFILTLKLTQKLMHIDYDYGFMLKTIGLFLIFICILQIVYLLHLDHLVEFGAGIVIFLLYITIVYNIFSVKKLFQEVIVNLDF
ncbi:oligosaccharide flippase family protein [uncultured Methanoregula sp.]|uniref:oligosaccharide flippase family protein n=1 Tax=uncultured Methanoregula sp. TaxID=1005933 RepID=UPI002AAC25BB|nr:oligosaccharide flippase family protein [uncultured Methanoregula sp.]